MTPRIHIQATFLRILFDDRGEKYIEACDYDLVLQKPRLLENPFPGYLAHLVRSTELYRHLTQSQWRLAKAQATLRLN